MEPAALLPENDQHFAGRSFARPGAAPGKTVLALQGLVTPPDHQAPAFVLLVVEALLQYVLQIVSVATEQSGEEDAGLVQRAGVPDHKPHLRFLFRVAGRRWRVRYISPSRFKVLRFDLSHGSVMALCGLYRLSVDLLPSQTL